MVKQVPCYSMRCSARRAHHDRPYENRPHQMVDVTDDWDMKKDLYAFCSLECACAAGKFHIQKGWIHEQPGKTYLDSWKDLIMTGAELIAAERERQVTVENWTPEHDDTHDTGGLTCAAMAYADAARKRMLGASDEHTLRIWNYWRWNKDWWKPSLDPVRNLVKAGALIAAEIDRLHRKENKNV